MNGQTSEMKQHNGDAAPTNAQVLTKDDRVDADPKNPVAGSEVNNHTSKSDSTSTVPSKRKAATKDEPSKAPRRSARGTLQPSIDPVKMLHFLVSPASTELCRPKDEIKDLKACGSDIKTYSSSPFTPFEELICAVVLSRPISHALGLRSIRTIFNDPWKLNTPESLREAGPDGRRKALDEARTQHRQKTADELGLLAGVLVDKLGDDEDDVAMERVRRECNYDVEKKELNVIKTSVKGMGKTGIDIFRRRIQGVWPECYPFIDQKTSASLEMFGLPTEAKDLETFIEKHWEELKVEDIEAKEEEEKKRKVFVRLLEHAVGAHLEASLGTPLRRAGSGKIDEASEDFQQLEGRPSIMSSPAISQVFRRLFSHQTCSRRVYTSSFPRSIVRYQHRTYRKKSSEETYIDGGSMESHWQQRTEILPPDKAKEYERYPMVDASALRTRKERPRRVKMLTRDFIEDSLYNPNYGYFPKQAVIFTPGEPFDFNVLPDEAAFHKLLGQRYTEFEDALDESSPSDTRQLWHTPTELFRPHYGEAIAHYLVTNYRLLHHPFHDLIIYEMGAGNGTLMLNILDFIRDFHPDVYQRTKFKIIEIAPALATLQTAQLECTADSRGHIDHVEIINRSIFNWDTYVASPCYFLSLEVFDNFAHDSIRYDPFTEQPLQGSVLIDNAGDFFEFYTKDIDPVASRFLRVRHDAASRPFQHPVMGSRWKRMLRARLPFAANLTVPEFIPTRLMQFFDILQRYFPLHQLLASDFNALPDAIQGVNAPVVQTRYQRRTVPVTTPLVQQGYFDILFPTDFAVIEDIYRAITGRLTRVLSHEDFLRRWSDVEATQCRNGESPMLSWYKNASVLTTV